MEVKPGYKQTEVGMIPNDWEVRRLGDLGTVVRGGSPRPAGAPRYFNGNFIPWLTVGSLTNIPANQLFVTDTATKLTKEGAKRSRTLQQGTLVIVNSGAKTLGVSKVLSITCCANDGIAALLNQSAGEKLFLCYFLNSQIKRLREVVATGNDQLNLNTGRIASIAVPFPEETEQRAIAGALGEVDALIGVLDQLITKKRDLKLAAMQQLLLGRTRLPGFHTKWEEKPIANIAAPTSERNVASEKLPVLTCSKHHGFVDSLRFFKNQVFSKDLSTYKVIHRGEIGYPANHVEEGSIGLQDLYEKALVSPIYVVFAVVEGINSFFLHRLLKLDSYKQKFKTATTSSVDRRGSLRWPAFSQITVRLPSLAEQNAIVEVLADIEAELVILERRRDKTRDLKSAMMQELLTGKTRLV